MKILSHSALNESLHDALASTDITRYWIDSPPAPQNDWVAREEPLEIRIQGRSIAVTMRTPGDDEELACGFLLSEGLLRQREDVMEVAHCLSGENAVLGNILNVFVSPHVRINFEQLTRHVFASSSCGLCGKASIESIHQSFPPIDSAPHLDPDLIRSLPEKLLSSQAAFGKTGGLHAAALFDQSGNLVTVREDVGRHNAVDKVVGWAFLNQHLPLAGHILLVSGRASFEIMQKALAGRIPVVAALSAPSSLAVDFARESRQTLIGFLRPPSFNVYSNSAPSGS